MKAKLKWGIRIYSKYTGESIVLGSKYNTEMEARKNAEIEVCLRCNRIEIFYFPENFNWVNKELGFVEPKIIKNES